MTAFRSNLIAGDSLDFETEIVDSGGNAYTADDGWAAKYRLIPRASGAVIEINGTYANGIWRFQASTGATSGWTADTYSWSLIVSKTGLRVTVEQGICVVAADVGAATLLDGRTQAERALDDAKAALANFNATGGRVKAYSIAGRSMEFDNGGEILKLVSFWTGEVNNEKIAASVARGLGNPTKVYARF
jgi:hypothetical protein